MPIQIAQLWLLFLHLPLDRDVLQPVGAPRYPDDVAMVADPVGDGAGRHLVSEHLGPAADAHVGGDHRGSPLVAGAHQLEQQVGAALVYVEVPQLVDDQQLRAGVVLEPLLQYSPGLRVLQVLHQAGAVYEPDLLARLHGLDLDRRGQVRLADAGAVPPEIVQIGVANPRPVPDGRGPARAQARERDTFKSERPLRQQAAVGESAKRAKSEFIFPSEGRWPVSEMCAALGATCQGHCARKGRAHAMRDGELAGLITRVRSEVRGIYGAPKAFFAPRRMGVRTSMRRAARIMRERGWRSVTRACAKRLSGEKRAARRVSRGPGQAQVRGRRRRHGAVRRHHLREDPAAPAAAGAGDGHMVEADSGLGQEKQPERMRASLGSRSPVRVAAAVQDRARAQRAPLHGLDILAVGQRGHGAAHGHREVGVRARAGMRHARRGRAGHLRVHRGGVQPGEDPLGAGLHEPGRV